MLTIEIPSVEVFVEEANEFLSYEAVTLKLEHSLVSLSKWESKFQKPFLSKDARTNNEMLGYIEAMILSDEIPEYLEKRLTTKNIDAIIEYIDSPQSATTFGTMPEVKRRGETITSELIYYWMVAYNIPFEVETWHLNRLFSLIKICNIKNSKPEKMSKTALAKRNRELNEQRRKQLGTSG